MNRFIPNPPCGKEAIYALLCSLTNEACAMRDELQYIMRRAETHKQRIAAVRDELKKQLTNEQP